MKINLELEELRNLYWAGTRASSSVAWVTNTSAVRPGSLASGSLYVDYIYLDADERRRFAQVTHEYLIEQLQFTGDESTTTPNPKIKMSFNHPVKELIWVVQPEDNVAESVLYGKQHFNFTDALDSSASDAASLTLGGAAAGGAVVVRTDAVFGTGENPVAFAKLQLNGHDRFSERAGSYFNLVQPYQHHENIPAKGINVYSFAIQPESHQPSGTCNMSRIDNATLQLTLTEKSVYTFSDQGARTGTRTARIKLFGVCYNVLRVMSGIKTYLLSQTVGRFSSSRDILEKENGVNPWIAGYLLLNNRLVVRLHYLAATFTKCGKLLTNIVTTLSVKAFKGPRLIAVPNGKNTMFWTIRSQAPNLDIHVKRTEYGEGSETRRKWVECGISPAANEDLRYSPCFRRNPGSAQGIGEALLIAIRLILTFSFSYVVNMKYNAFKALHVLMIKKYTKNLIANSAFP